MRATRLAALSAPLCLTLGLLAGCGSDEPQPEPEPQGRLEVVTDPAPTSAPTSAPAPAPARPAPARPDPAPAAPAAPKVQGVKLNLGLDPTIDQAMEQIAAQAKVQIVVDSRARGRKITLEGIDLERTPWNVLVELLARQVKCQVKSTASGVLMIVPRR